jgi:hypothetical protein
VRTFFLGGIDKARVLRELRPHIFFRRSAGLRRRQRGRASFHVPFGVANAPPMQEVIAEAIEANVARNHDAEPVVLKNSTGQLSSAGGAQNMAAPLSLTDLERYVSTRSRSVKEPRTN